MRTITINTKSLSVLKIDFLYTYIFIHNYNNNKMEEDSDTDIQLYEIVQLEASIRKLLKADNNVELFIEYKSNRFTAYTLNPKNYTIFELYSENEIEYEHVNYYSFLKNLKCYIGKNKKYSQYFSYTVTWYKRGTSPRYKSHFYVSNIEELLSKFYADKYKYDYIIDSIKMNPIS